VLGTTPSNRRCPKCKGQKWIRGKGWSSKKSRQIPGPWLTSQGILTILGADSGKSRTSPSTLDFITSRDGPLDWLLALQHQRGKDRGGGAIEEAQSGCNAQATCWAMLALAAVLENFDLLKAAESKRKQIKSALSLS